MIAKWDHKRNILPLAFVCRGHGLKSAHASFTQSSQRSGSWGRRMSLTRLPFHSQHVWQPKGGEEASHHLSQRPRANWQKPNIQNQCTFVFRQQLTVIMELAEKRTFTKNDCTFAFNLQITGICVNTAFKHSQCWRNSRWTYTLISSDKLKLVQGTWAM